MKISNLLKLFPILALMFMMNVPSALAGGTNRGDNTSAEPGEKATTTRDVNDPAHDRRKGTTNSTNTGTDQNKRMNKPQNHYEQGLDSETTGTGSGTSGTGTGGTGTGGSDSGTGDAGTDSSGGQY